MRRWLWCVLMLSLPPARAIGAAPSTRQGRLEISGTAQGGTLSAGAIGNKSDLLTVNTEAGETASQIIAKLVAEQEEQDPGNSPFAWVEASPDGSALIVDNADTGGMYLRTTDEGIQTVGAVTDLRATSSKSELKTALTWTLPSPQPDAIVVVNFARGWELLGNATSLEDTQDVNDLDSAGLGRKRDYYVVCLATGTDGKLSRSSDMVHVSTDNPRLMTDDTLKIMPPQEYVRAAVKDAPYRFTMVQEAATNPVTWALDSGALPDGLSLTAEADGDRALIEGTPTSEGTWSLVVGVTDASGNVATAAYTITVTPYPILDQ